MNFKLLAWVFGVMASSLISCCVFARAAQGSKHVEDDALPTIPMTTQDIERCGMSMLAPKLLGTPASTNCASGDWRAPPDDAGPAFGMVDSSFISGYKTGNGPDNGNYPENAAQEVKWFVVAGDIDNYFKHIPDNALRRSEDGLISMQVIPGCHDSGAQKNVPISGPNWTGYLVEEVSPPHEKLSANCPVPTPMYRCVGMIIGNAKQTAVLKPYCFLSKRENNLYHGLSFDIFMDMVKTIHFVEQ